MIDPKHPIYPPATKGANVDNHDYYAKPLKANGPKMGDTQTKIIWFGVVFFVLFLIAFAFFAGFGSYL